MIAYIRSVLFVLCAFLIASESLMASYQISGRDLNDLLGDRQTGVITASSGNEADTVFLKYSGKNLEIFWDELSLDAEGKNDLGKRRLESGSGIMHCQTVTLKGQVTDKCGVWGGDEFDHVQITAPALSLSQTMISFKESAAINASDDTSSIIRGITFTKKAGTNYPLICGNIDFTLKDGIFSSNGLPLFAISGIETLSLFIDKGKF